MKRINTFLHILSGPFHLSISLERFGCRQSQKLSAQVTRESVLITQRPAGYLQGLSQPCSCGYGIPPGTEKLVLCAGEYEVRRYLGGDLARRNETRLSSSPHGRKRALFLRKLGKPPVSLKSWPLPVARLRRRKSV